MAANYRKIYKRIFKDEKFSQLSPIEKLVCLYGIIGQSNRIGYFSFSVALAAEDCGVTPDQVRKALDTLCHTLSWRYDAKSRVLLIPTWFNYNKPENAKALKGYMQDIEEVPRSPLISEFITTCESSLGVDDTLWDTLSIGYRKGMPYTETETETETETDSNPSDYSAEPSKAQHSQGSGLFFQCKSSNGKAWELPAEKLAEYETTFGEFINVRAELGKARQWLIDNPANRKTPGGMKKFLTSWLNRANDRGTAVQKSAKDELREAWNSAY